MAEPTQLTCKHRFCIQCLDKTFLSTRACPLCRRKHTAALKIDTAFQKTVKESLPKTFEKRFSQLDNDGLLFADQIKVAFEVGNRCKPADMKGAKGKEFTAWTAFVRLKDPELGKLSNLISKVKFELHETYRDPIRFVKEEKNKEFALSTTAWGTFDVPMTIFWNPKTGIKDPVTVDHYLSFDQPGKWKTIEISLSMKKLKGVMPGLAKLAPK